LEPGVNGGQPAAITAADCLDRPATVADRLLAEHPCLRAVSYKLANGTVTFRLEFVPLRDLELYDYPDETVHVTVTRSGDVYAWVPTDDREWMHTFGGEYFCLWYPDDPPALQWDWSRGFGAYVVIVHRHLLYEEYRRRHGGWPVEDAPHGRTDTPHPIRSLKLRSIAGQELRL
jgi:hypothetical protein